MSRNTLIDTETVTIIQDGNIVDVVEEGNEVVIVANVDAGIRDYNRLMNKPSINGVPLIGDMVVTDADLRPVLVKDESGEYTSISRYFNANRDGLVYTIKIPKYASDTGTVCVKADANTGMICEPSTNIELGRDDYAALKTGPFLILECNGIADGNGLPHVYAISGDGVYKIDGSYYDALIAAPVLWWRITEDESYIIISISDSYHPGFELQPGAKLPDGSIRPYMLYAKYPGVMVGDDYMSASGYPIWNFASHNNLVDKCVARGNGYAPTTHADDWYISVMFLMKYARKSSQEIYGGCTSYNYQPFVSVSETGVKRVILANADAANLVAGSSVSIGTMQNDATKSKDRSNAHTRDIANTVKILSIEDYDADHKAVNVDVAESFDTVADTTLVSTMAWRTGCCDNVLGRDGSPIDPTSMKNPFKIQGIELMHGYYEILGNVIAHAHVTEGDEQRSDVYICYDSADGLKTTANYTNTEVTLGVAENGGLVYQQDIANAGGLIVGVGSGATTSTGTGDATYSDKKSTSNGFREVCARGSLAGGSAYGLRCVAANCGLTPVPWTSAGRPSLLGRSAA